MDGGLVDRIEAGAARGASALFAAAVGYAGYGLSGTAGVEPQFALGAAGLGALVYWPCSRLLGAGGDPNGRFVLPEFAPRDFAFAEAPDELLLTDKVAPDELLLTDRVASVDELLLTDADRVDAPLDLDDILAEMGPDSRVVRLFDPKAMPAPTPGQLQSRIADHLKDGASLSTPSNTPAPSTRATPTDASQALSAALAELRRSLR